MAVLEIRTKLGGHRGSWDALVAAARPPKLALRSWWLDALGEPDLRYVLVVEDDRLLGGMVFNIQHTARFAVPVVRMTGSGYFGSSHADLLIAPGAEDAVTGAFSDWFASMRQCIVDLTGLVERSRLGDVLPVAHSSSRLGDAPYVRLPDDFDTYLGQRSKSFRSSLKRQRRRLEAVGYRYRRLATDELELGSRELRRLHVLRHGAASEFTPRFETFADIVRAGAAADEFAFHVMAREDEIIAIDAVFEIAGHADDFQSGLDVSHPEVRGAGFALVASVIEDGCARGLQELDLEAPADAYKLRFTDLVRRQARLHATWGWAPVWVPRARRVVAALRTPVATGAALLARDASDQDRSP